MSKFWHHTGKCFGLWTFARAADMTGQGGKEVIDERTGSSSA
jgi:hypothetical protein